MIRGIDMNAHSIQGRLAGFLGTRVQHFVANAGRVWIPGNENELARWPAIDRFEIQINHPVSAIVFGKFRDKIFVRLGALALFINDNGFLVLNLVDIVTELFALLQLELVESAGHFVVDYYSSALKEWAEWVVVVGGVGVSESDVVAGCG